jgi:GNAT superfamily N-acetyltransferase
MRATPYPAYVVRAACSAYIAPALRRRLPGFDVALSHAAKYCKMQAVISPCADADTADVLAVVNDGASAYRGIIAPDRWKEPYMPLEELVEEIGAGVRFWGWREEGRLLAVMGLQHVEDVALIRHAYTRTAVQGRGFGSALLAHVRRQTQRPLLVGTWRAAGWAVRFYERRGFRLVPQAEKQRLLRRYWNVPERQIEESVVLSAG